MARNATIFWSKKKYFFIGTDILYQLQLGCYPLAVVQYTFKTKINQQNAQINSGLIYYWSITPTCFGPSVEAIISDFEILESYKAIVLIC